MRNRLALGFLALAAWLLSSTAAWAVALGKIDVTSRLGEPFFAEVPLQLDPGESVSNVYVELASPADYRILEIYRDPALNAIQAEVKSDKRGPRVVLSSKGGVNTPFFNLVLKVRYERATHFKKYPVFLDIPKAAAPVKAKPLPTVTQGEAKAQPVPVTAAPAPAAEPKAAPKPGSTFKPFDGWARISRYGPLVYGDNVSTVAQRLRIDNRFTMNQVIAAIYQKNRDKFSEGNVNLVHAGTYLEVPKAAEVSRISPAEASRFMASQEKAWRQLIKQPKYAAAAEAQKHRYSKRVRMGEKASGAAAAPMATQAKPAAAAPMKPTAQPAAAGSAGADTAAQQQVQQLKQQNADLQDKLNAAQKQLAEHTAKADLAAAAATDAKIKKLEIQVARLQAERDEAMQKAAAKPSPLGWLSYALAGVIVLLLAVIGFLMRRERTHPATEYAIPESGFDEDTGEHAAYAPAEPESEVESEAGEAVETGEEALQAGMDEPEEEASAGVPELTEEDTGEMEAFREPGADQPDPNVDYLAEADVYLRYGMEDEAIQQVRLALDLDAGNAEAHAKMAQLLSAKNDQPALDAAMAAARQALTGDALDRFEQAVATLDQGGEASFLDTLPPTAQAEASAEIDLGDLDVAWSDLEDAETPAAEPEAPAAEAEAPEAQPEAAAVEESAEAEEAHAFDLSDIEFPETGSAETAPLAPTDDLDKTVAIGPREVAEAIGAEPEFDIEPETATASEAAESEAAAPESETTEPEEPAPAASEIDEDMDLGGFDFDQGDLDQAVGSASEDEFTSTIRTTLPTEGEADTAEDETPELDLSAELEVDAGKDEEEKGDALSLEDVDAAHDELNSLLDELADESEKDGDGKNS